MTILEQAHEDRLDLVRESRASSALTPVNGIDFIDVDPASEGTLFVSFVFDVNTTVDPALPTAVGGALSAASFLVIGGERITPIAVTSIGRIASNRIAVSVAPVGDFSIYTLQLGTSSAAPSGFDPMLCSASFIFHVECAKRFDCKAVTVCPPDVVTAPPIDYLAKDYPAFVRVMLDRLSLLAPRWQERHAADLGVAVVEVLAYVADQLSYRHDVVDTEAYIETARLRTSLRRHARLVDYTIGDGANARVWLALTLSNDIAGGVPAGTRCATGFDGAQAPDLTPSAANYIAAINGGARFFEVLADRFDTSEPPKPQPRALYAANNAMPIYNWSATEICLPAGAVSATLDGAYTLSRGDFLILAEAKGPLTGDPSDANAANRQVVRLIADGAPGFDPLYGTAKPITNVTWHPDDALSFPLCVSSRTDLAHGSQPLTGVSVAYGNVILADHGRTLGSPAGAPLENMPEPLAPAPADSRFRPQLGESPLTFAAPNPYLADQLAAAGSLPASALAASTWPSGSALPEIVVSSVDTLGNTLTWAPAADLLDASGETPGFVTEVENDGSTFLRFGDNTSGLAATMEMSFAASYRTGNGTAGNVGRETIVLIDRTFPGGAYIESLLNPLAAAGGVDPETAEHVRQNAPVAFLTQERCVTEADYANRAMQMPGVARAAATFRWTGSWQTMFVTIERTGNALLDPGFKAEVVSFLDPYRMAGVDLEVEDAIRVPLSIAMHVCVEPGYVATDVEAVLLQVFSSGVLPDGTLAQFNPARFTMGTPFYLSPLIAAAQDVDGVQNVRIDAFARESDPSNDATAAGVLVPQALELFELANDPNYPERGYFALTVDGGL